MKLPTNERVFVTDNFSGIWSCQVCVVPDATDEEILAACNDTLKGLPVSQFTSVVRTKNDCKRLGISEEGLPGPCADCPGRIHMIARA